MNHSQNVSIAIGSLAVGYSFGYATGYISAQAALPVFFSMAALGAVCYGRIYADQKEQTSAEEQNRRVNEIVDQNIRDIFTMDVTANVDIIPYLSRPSTSLVALQACNVGSQNSLNARQ